MLHIRQAKYICDYQIWLAFDDGSDGIVDLQDALHGPMFEPLLDPATFQSFRLDPELETLVWANGADFAPEFLKSLLSQH